MADERVRGDGVPEFVDPGDQEGSVGRADARCPETMDMFAQEGKATGDEMGAVSPEGAEAVGKRYVALVAPTGKPCVAPGTVRAAGKGDVLMRVIRQTQGE